MKEEEELKIAETAFDSFLQENDRLSMEAQKKYISKLFLNFSSETLDIQRAELEAKITSEKDEEIKRRNEEILQLKSDIYDLKDVYTRYTSYGKFLEKISPEDWRSEKVGERKKK